MSVVFSEGVARGRLSLERLTDVLAAAPARLFGLGSKGGIAEGRDADLVVWDPNVRRTLRQRDLHHTSDYTPYEGRSVSGGAVRVLSRGVESAVGSGRFLERHLAR